MLWGVLLLAGAVAGAINALAGGGSFLTLTALVVMGGMSVEMANGTNRVGIVAQSLAAALAFRHAGQSEWRLVGRLTPAVVLGAVVGAQVSLDLPRTVMERVVGAAMVGMMALLVWKPERFLRGAARAPRLHLGVVDLVFFLVGLYGGFLQAGVGVFLLMGLVGFAGRDLVAANVAKVVLALVFSVPALVVFAAQGAVDWGPGVVLAIGSALGGAVGARIAVWGGAKMVRWVLFGVLTVSSVRFFLG